MRVKRDGWPPPRRRPHSPQTPLPSSRVIPCVSARISRRKPVCALRMIWVWMACLLFPLLLLSPVSGYSAVTDERIEFHNPNKGYPFEKMVIDPSTTRLYVGGVNHLYDLHSVDLSVRVHAVTGPKEDSVECSGGEEACTKVRSVTDSHTKSLAVHDKSSKLIECTGLFQGRCRLRNLHNITESLVESSRLLANDANSSAVIFVGSGPLNESSLYVASTFVGGSSYRDDIPAISSRSLTPRREFALSHSNVNSQSSVFLERKYRESYKVEYVGGFEAGRFAYFASRQPRSLKDEIIQSRLLRVCTGDKEFNSYAEVPLECESNEIRYNLLRDVYIGTAGYNLAKELGITGEGDLLMYAVFEEGATSSPRRDVPTSRSALCIYTIKEIEAVFKKNILECYQKENIATKLPWFTVNQMCRQTRLQWEAVECGQNVNTRIGGGHPIQAEPIIQVPDARLTSVATNTTHGSTVVFMGTRDGRLLKAVLEQRGPTSFVYAAEQVSNDSILQDLEFSESGRHAFLLTPSSVIRVSSSNCDRAASTCAACLSQRDPHCGWCVKSSSCSLKQLCDRNIPHHLDTGWIPYNTDHCPSIRSVFPDKVQLSSADFLNVTMENISGVQGGGLRCLFKFPNGLLLRSDAVGTKNDESSIRCATPDVHSLPAITPGESSLIAVLSVIPASSSSLPPLASTNFTFFDCTRFATCSECAQSQFPCDWCLRSNICVSGQQTEDRCRGEVFINGIGRSGTSSRRGPSHCPHITAVSPTIHVLAGEKRSVSVKAQNIDKKFMVDFRCRFTGKAGFVKDVVAVHTEDGKIRCEDVYFEGVGAVTLDVVWSSIEERDRTIVHSLDNIQKIGIEVYKCEETASDCGSCISLDSSKYACGWCLPALKGGQQDKGKCVPASSCQPSFFLNGSQLCPHPAILSFTPHKAPLGGNTTLQVTGLNLGRNPSDIRAVTVANVPCRLLPSLHQPPSILVCVTGAAIRQRDERLPYGPVVVSLKEDTEPLAYTAISNDKFFYVEPAVNWIEPSVGPLAGGTDISLRGDDLDAGTYAQVQIGEDLCDLQTRNATTIVCRTRAAETVEKRHIHVSIDGQRVKMARASSHFTYSVNPKLIGVDPERSIVAGGVKVEVTGEGFHLLQRPKMILFGLGEETSEGDTCERKSYTVMLCSTPPLPSSIRATAYPIEVRYTFQFDASTTKSGSLLVYPNPVMTPFTETRYYRPGENYLTINGENINMAANERDVNVTVGGVECTQVVLSARVLTCRPPDVRPPISSDVDPEVMVSIAGLAFHIGPFSYDVPGIQSPAIAAIAAFVIAMLLLFLLLLILYKRKTNSHARQMKVLKSKMDQIEMRVAAECKEAFAELQTSLHAYTAELPLGAPAVPFLEYREYASRVLFPNNYTNHPALRELQVDSCKAASVENALKEFHKLLMNKTFLLTMVRTMESNKYFVGKDRVYLGSLLMVVLQERMAYCTDILKQLLRELIERTVEKKFQPKILFRRSESVAERMLAAWFTFLMHNYLTESAGKRLYDLYWVIKQQMEKGPQDAITLEARYSLSEEKLLRASVEVREMVIVLGAESTPSMAFTSPPPLTVRVLSCDSITQVKEKCLEARYRTLPCSERPRAEDLDLECRAPHIPGILQDVDFSSKTEPGGWKRINTLAHYRIPNNAILVLVPRQSSMYNLSLLSEKSSLSMKASPTLSRPFGTTSSSAHSKDNDSCKLYHLVKPSEHGPNEGQEKMVTEVYLTRLLMMKGTLHKFINDLLEVIFSSSRYATLPACVKYMFDFMDSQALEYGITDPEVTHAWKSNALPLRFWVNLIKNPHFVFDIPKPTKIEGTLSVVAQTLMDACSTQEQQLTKDSPSSKLLFAKDMFLYRDWVDSYYSQVAKMEPIDEAEMVNMLNDESKMHRGQLQIFPALNELYKYLDQYKEPVMEALESNEHAQLSQLPARLQDVLSIMESQRCSEYDSNTLGLGYNSSSRLMAREGRL